MTGVFASIRTLSEHDDLVLVRGSSPERAARLWVVARATAEAERLANAYSLRERLDPDWAARPLAFGAEGLPASSLLLEDPGGELLSEYVGKLELEGSLRVALALAGTVRKLHQAGLLHRDVKPSHFLVDLTASRAWLIGFGIAAQLDDSGRAPGLRVEGTLAYMAPEQSARTNCAVGQRSDLYALGITLYELFTGRPPFQAEDARGYFHQHIASAPDLERLRRAGVPDGLSALVRKLLEKGPERRYATASALELDLRRCLAQWEATGTVAPFALGVGDASPGAESDVLYGRAQLLEDLQARAEGALGSGAAGLICVAGPSGVGKTSAVHGLRRRLPWLRFASGKFDQQAMNIPHATFAQAFRALVRDALAQSDTELERVRTQLEAKLAGNGALLLNLVPELALILGPQPEVHDLTPLDAQKRFQGSVRALLSVFATAERPLLLFLDDLHVADPASTQLLQHLVGHTELPHLLLVAAYREQELTSPAPWLRARELLLPPLSLAGVVELVEGRLQLTTARAQPIAQLLHARTAGNPFYVSQLLRALIDEQQVAFRDDAWQATPARDEPSEGVIELLLARLAALPADTRALVQELACLGQATREVLCIATAQQELPLAPAIDAGLIVERAEGYAFLHDRIQEAAYRSLAEPSAAHFRIGTRLAERAPEQLFVIVNQLERGLVHASEAQYELIAQLNLEAGRRAQVATAHASALAFFARGDALCAALPWSALRFELSLHRAECEVLTGALDAAEGRLAELTTRTHDLPARARVTCLHSALYTTLGQPDRSVEVCLAYLREAGFAWSARPSQQHADDELARMWSTIGDTPIEALIELPTMTDPRWVAVMDVLGDLLAPAFFSDARLFQLVVAGAINTTLAHGNSHGGALAYMTLAAALATHLHDSRASYRFGKLGYALSTERGFDRYKARIEMFFGLSITQWGRPIREGRAVVQRTSALLEATDVTYIVYIRHLLVSHMLLAGDPLARVESEIERSLALARETQFGLAVIILETQRGLVRSMRGGTRALGSFEDDDFDERRLEQTFADDARLGIAAVWYWIRKLQARFLAGDLEAAVAAAEQADPLLWIAGIGTVEHVDMHLFAGLARAAMARTQGRDLRGEVERHRAQLAAWAGPCPENFAHAEALVAAELARLDGDDARAMELYERALRGAAAQGFVHHEAIAAEQAADLHGARGLTTAADAYLRRAAQGYLRWGALAKLEQLRARHPALASVVPRADATFGASEHALDLATVLAASRALSGEIVLERQLSTLLSLALEHAGAERGVLLLMRQHELRVVASAQLSERGPTVALQDASVQEWPLALSALNTVTRVKLPLWLDDASADEVHASDRHVRERGVRSLLLVPIVEQARLLGVLYCENNLATRAFASGSSAVLELLAAQAAISLENARLYRELEQENARRERALRERGELLREVHHRVKNNLQLISSLLSLQASRTTDPKVAEQFADSKNRVHSMALVHENLYRADDFSEVAMEAHLRSVCVLLARVYAAPRRGIAVLVESDPLRLPLGLAVPCGLIANELVSNALKHAFPHDGGGQVRVSLSAPAEGRLRLEVHDDGIGFACDASGTPAESLGLQLVQDLTRQLRGEITLHGPGSCITVDFPATSRRA
ncbi:MAG: AAA family ATPase [Polyangiales bacterium]